MKKQWMWAVAVVCVLAAAGSYGADLVNPSFEDPLDSEDFTSDQAEGWGRWGAWINRETGWSPTHSGECLLGYHHWRIEDDNSSGVYQDVSGVSAGTECTFSIYAFRDENCNVKEVELRLESYNGGQTLASAKYRPASLSGSKWKLITVTGETKSEGVRVLIIAYPETGHNRDGALKFDDARLEFGD